MPLKRQSLEYCHGFFGASNTYRFDNEKWQSQLIRNDSIIRTVFYFDDYEEIAENGCTYSQYFLDNNVIVIKRNGSFEFYQGFTDHLGNILDVYDSNGQAIFEASYDAWGRQTVTKNNIGVRYGYTGHEMLPEFGLIDMKGRVYDPALRRFLSPDKMTELVIVEKFYQLSENVFIFVYLRILLWTTKLLILSDNICFFMLIFENYGNTYCVFLIFSRFFLVNFPAFLYIQKMVGRKGTSLLTNVGIFRSFGGVENSEMFTILGHYKVGYMLTCRDFVLR